MTRTLSISLTTFTPASFNFASSGFKCSVSKIVDLVTFLNGMGANIKGAGTNVIRIEGVKELYGVEATGKGNPRMPHLRKKGTHDKERRPHTAHQFIRSFCFIYFNRIKPATIVDAPHLDDVSTICSVLESLGVKVTHGEGRITFDAVEVIRTVPRRECPP